MALGGSHVHISLNRTGISAAMRPVIPDHKEIQS
jgi:hypothetical protein